VNRLFLDANVLFSAAYRDQSGLARLWKLKRVKLLSSAYAVEEARRNLAEAAQRKRLAQLARAVEIIDVVSALSSEPGLPAKDEPILRAAVAARATHLLTGDVRHFGRFLGTRLEGILVLLPGEYLRGHSGR
jgi:predicted nucleic acid-binding protein